MKAEKLLAVSSPTCLGAENSVKAFAEDFKALADSTHVFQSETGGAEEQHMPKAAATWRWPRATLT